jgi:hypothetical protein
MPRILHVMNGDSARAAFEPSGLPGDAIVYADALLEGPVPADVTDAELLAIRERFWDGAAPRQNTPLTAESSLLARWQRGMETFPQYDEAVLWFEHDLFDQLLLIRHLDWFARRGFGSTRLSLICVGEFAGIDRFWGLGQLTPSQLASVFETRAPITPEQFDLGRAAWQAFTSADPTRIERLIASDTSALPFLGPALRRWLEEFPAAGNGLPRSEAEILSTLDDTERPLDRLFDEWLRHEDVLMPTDTSLVSRLEAMASGPHPLVRVQREIGHAGTWLPGTAARTAIGGDVAAGRADWVALTPFDRWLGGVHVTNDSMWRWDAAQRRLRRT